MNKLDDEVNRLRKVLQRIAELHESSELWQEIAREALPKASEVGMDGNIAAYEQFYPEETGVECPSCKGGHFVTKMEIESNCCWYCGGSIKNRKGNEDMENEYSEPKPQEYRLFMDGNAWCAVCGDFVDLQNSPAGFGDTPTEALQNLLQIFQGATP